MVEYPYHPVEYPYYPVEYPCYPVEYPYHPKGQRVAFMLKKKTDQVSTTNLSAYDN